MVKKWPACLFRGLNNLGGDNIFKLCMLQEKKYFSYQMHDKWKTNKTKLFD